MPGTDRLPTADGVRAAAGRLAGVAVRTPLLEFEAINRLAGGRILIKAETFQPVGAFKIRGAWNMMVQLDEDARRAGVVAFSSGNHAQAVAWAARRLGIPATIVMPHDAPAVKVAGTRSYGAEVVQYDRYAEDREHVAARLLGEKGGTMVPPYDDPLVIEGQGTVGHEIVAQCAAAGVIPDAVIVPCSGGGLVAGCALVLREAWPRTGVYSAEPVGLDDTARSLVSGTRERNAPDARSICDALAVPTPGRITFEVNRRLLAGGLVVPDDAVRSAMEVAFRLARLVVEPGGAVGLAAVLSGCLKAGGRTVCVVCSGGNVDPALFAGIISTAPAPEE